MSWRRALPTSLMARLRCIARPCVTALAFVRWGVWRRRAAPRSGPICVVGLHSQTIGIGDAARRVSHALRLAGAQVVDWDVSARFGRAQGPCADASGEPPAEAAALVIVLNPPELVQLVAMTGAAPFRGRFCVGAWAWELSDIPRGWRAAFRYVDEAWGCSRFVADAIAARAPEGLPVRVLAHPALAAAPPVQAGDRVQVLTVFDAGSGFTRKNPLASVRAFRLANVQGLARMVIKASGANTAPEAMAQLQAEIGTTGDVTLTTERLSNAGFAELMEQSDIILSTHRSEGFGLSLAQAMADGKPVVATGWSGNLDFMSQDDSRLIAYRLVPVDDPQGFYESGLWADPEIEDAARQLKVLIEDPQARAALGRKAADAAARKLDPLTIGRQARLWLEGVR